MTEGQWGQELRHTTNTFLQQAQNFNLARWQDLTSYLYTAFYLLTAPHAVHFSVLDVHVKSQFSTAQNLRFNFFFRFYTSHFLPQPGLKP